MSGIWLKDGTHFNIQDEASEEIAKEMREKGSATFLGVEVRMVRTTPSRPLRILKNKALIS